MDEGTCREAIERLGKGSLFHDESMIVLCANWPRYITHSTHEGAMALAETLAAQGREVAIVGLMSMQEASSTAFVAVRRGLSSDQANRFAYGTIQGSKIDKPNADALALAMRFPTIRYLDKYAVFSDDTARTTSRYDDEGRILFADNFHLTRAGGVYFGKRIAALGWFGEKSNTSSRDFP